MIHDRINIGDFKVFFNITPEPGGQKHTLKERFFQNKEITPMEAFYGAQYAKDGPVMLYKCTNVDPHGGITWEMVKMKQIGEI